VEVSVAKQNMTRTGAAIATFLAVAPALAQTKQPYLFDVLKQQPAYRAAWDKLLASGKVPTWLTAFSKNYDGVTEPATTANVGGVTYQMFQVCKPHDCAGNQFEVMFSPGAQTAKGALVDNNATPRFLGAPNAAQEAALMRALAN
jgi:hypothetical protein